MGDNDIEAQQGRLNNGANPQPPQSLSPTEKQKKHLQLYRAALNGDWDIAKNIYEKYQSEIKYNAEITRRKETALHIAAAAESVHFVEHLAIKMSNEDLALPNEAGNTAFCLAAISGKVAIAEAMMSIKRDLAMTPGREGMLPIYMAALMGHRKMVRFLYDATKDQLEYDDKKELFISVINSDMYDIAKEMLTENRELATARVENEETALHALAKKPSLPKKSTYRKLSGLWKKCINLSSEQALEKIDMHEAAHDLVQDICNEVVLLKDEDISSLIISPWRLIFTAAKNGNVEFLTILIHSYPDIILKVNNNNYSIFHIAVLYRHEDIFKLIHEIGSIKNMIITYTDKKENNMLHLAARKPSVESRLHVVPGAALQLQRELLWFEEVKKLVQPQQLAEVNRRGFTPEALMMESHKELMKDGEKWMRGTANSCMVVATLIATVVFAAGFTVPGGNNQDNGIPIFLRKTGFKVFAVTNAVSLITSVSSVLTFLSIMTSRYAIYDFYKSLPNKLIVGLVTLFVSIVTMLMAFAAALFLAFDHGNNLIWYAIPIAAFASAPVFLFGYQHHRLFMDVMKSTWMSKSIFKPNKTPLFAARVGDKKND